MSGPTISLLELRDEFAFVRNDANYAEVANALSPNSVKVVLVRGKRNKGVSGVISETHFLQVCSTRIDPVKTLARDKMLTDILRLRDDTPMEHAVEVIEERDPDAVLVLNAENKFVGYLSPQDFKELQINQVKIGGKKESGPQSPPPAKGDVSHSLNLGDEFTFVRNDAMFSDASRMLAPDHVKVILVRGKKNKGIAGVLTEPEFLKVCSTGIDPNKTLVSKHMLTDILRIRSDTPLDEAVKIIGERDPDAVLVLSKENKFVGYLSPADYNEALELLKKKNIEVFDVPTIKPEIPPPPPPSKPPPPKQEIMLEEDVFNIPQRSVVNHISNILRARNEEPVIWQEDGSDVLVHTSSLAAVFHNGLASFTIDMECDQCGREPLVVRFYLGTKGELSNMMAAKEESPLGHPILVGRWAEPLQDAIWYGLLDLVSETTGDAEAVGIGADEGNLWIRKNSITDNSSTQNDRPSLEIQRLITIKQSLSEQTPIPTGGGRK